MVVNNFLRPIKVDKSCITPQRCAETINHTYIPPIHDAVMDNPLAISKILLIQTYVFNIATEH